MAPCYSAAFIEDVTVPDGTGYSAGTSFGKTWRVQNTGSCTWTTAYQMIFTSGDHMSGPDSINLTSTVYPGQTIDVSAEMRAPSESGTYTGYWRLEAPDGTIFGPDLVVQIDVTNSIDVRSIDINVNDSNVTLTCPPGNKFSISAQIRTNGSGEVTYYWEFSNGDRSDEHTLTFDDSHTRTVSTTFQRRPFRDFLGPAARGFAGQSELGSGLFHPELPDAYPAAYAHPEPYRHSNPRPTSTPLPTHTPRPTHTPVPTHTPRPTHTPTPT